MTLLKTRIAALVACTVPPFAHGDILDYMNSAQPKAEVTITNENGQRASPKTEPVGVGAQSKASPSGATAATGSGGLPAPSPTGGPSSGLCDGS